jgi:hypothetical protein
MRTILRARLATIVYLPVALGAQAVHVTPDTGHYVPLTPHDRWHDYRMSLIGPSMVVSPLLDATSTTLDDTPKWWAKNPDGFAKRLGAGAADHVVDANVDAAVSAVLHEDNHYYRCSCERFGRRAAHAIIESILATTDNGRKTLAVGRIAGFLTGGLTSSAIYGRNYGAQGGLRLGAYAVAGQAVVNLAQEFLGHAKRR